jgi:hypothetical protein
VTEILAAGRWSTNGRKTAREHLAAIGLYCRTGAGLEALAPVICREVREMIGGAAAALYWLDEDQQPVGYYHEDAPPMPRELFQNQLQELFDGPEQMSAVWLARQTGQSIGRMFNPPASFYDSNVFNLLIKACGHHHTLDVRIDAQGIGRALFGLFRIESEPFTRQEVASIAVIQPLLQNAVENVGADPLWIPAPLLKGTLAVTADGTQLIACSQEATRLLADVSLIGQNLSCDPEKLSQPPRFITALIAAGGAEKRLGETYPVPGGRLSVLAQWMDSTGMGGQGGFWVIDLQMLVCREIEIASAVLEKKLTPLQREIALHALLGGERSECLRRFDVSKDALKLHVRAILKAFGAESWNELVRNHQRQYIQSNLS